MSPGNEQRPGVGTEASSKAIAGSDKAIIPQNTDNLTAAEQGDLFKPWPTTVPKRPSSGPQMALANADDWWLSTALAAIKAAAGLSQPWEPSTLQQAFGLPDPDSPKRWGALLLRAKRDGLVEFVYYAPSKKPTSNGRVVAWYRTRKGGAN